MKKAPPRRHTSFRRAIERLDLPEPAKAMAHYLFVKLWQEGRREHWLNDILRWVPWPEQAEREKALALAKDRPREYLAHTGRPLLTEQEVARALRALRKAGLIKFDACGNDDGECGGHVVSLPIERWPEALFLRAIGLTLASPPKEHQHAGRPA